jgi:putative hydrolase of the HAD superfamily
VVVVLVVLEVLGDVLVVEVETDTVSATSVDDGDAVSPDVHEATNDTVARMRRTARGDRKAFMGEPTLRPETSGLEIPRFDVIAFDADDTLWHSEDGFHAAENTFRELLTPFVADGVDLRAALVATERANLSTYGYGVKAFGLSMLETSLSVSQGRVTADVMERLLAIVRELLLAPVRLLPGVAEVIIDLARDHRVAVITKGDLVHQTRKVSTSGIAHLFDHVEIVLEKDPETYVRVLREFDVEPHRFCMVGNSVKSDVLPVLEIGGHAVHVPYHVLWELERAEHPVGHGRFGEVENISEVPDWVRHGSE